MDIVPLVLQSTEGQVLPTEAGLIPTYPQEDVKDRLVSLWVTCGQHVVVD